MKHSTYVICICFLNSFIGGKKANDLHVFYFAKWEQGWAL